MVGPAIKPEFSHPVPLGEIGANPHVVQLKARPEERRDLVARFGIEDLPELSGEVALSWQGEEVVAEGRIHARAVQACIVTLEPVEETIDETFRVVFANRPDDVAAHEPPGEEYAEERELVEPLEGDSIDVGELLAQQLSLALDPYPRAEEASFEEEASKKGVKSGEGERAEEENPFAVLKQLKDEE